MSTVDRKLQAVHVRRRCRGRLLTRMMIGCLVVIAAVAATIATGTLLEVKQFVDALNQNPPLKFGKNVLATANPGGPQTLLLIGSDKRAKGAIDASGPPHSDTMMLVRLDPNESNTTVLSVPRDLKVTIHPDHGAPTTQKINAAYSIGGPKLAVKTVKQLLGIKINHVVDINFAGFKELVNYLGCVYVQVDRRYYHSNAGLAASDTYSEIDIQPGYQKLCGDDALAYVRYRHTDTDLVRSARQQDFLRQIKNQIGAGGLISRRAGIEKIFGKYSSTDLHGYDEVLKLLELLVQSASHPVRQVTFDGSVGPSYVTADRAQIARTRHAFLNGGAAPPQVATATNTPAHTRHASGASTQLIQATADARAEAHAVAASLPLAMYYPVSRVGSPFGPPDIVRAYKLHGQAAYVVVVAQGDVGQYYDLEGTTWRSPPILNNPNQTVTVGGRQLNLYFEGQKIRLIAWRDVGGVYWVTNTLQNILTNRQMLAIAAAARPV
jgi:polyisoprenyl-teichoic acid--peptidoglycan teichoic acid transferase